MVLSLLKLMHTKHLVQGSSFVVVQSLNHVRLFATPLDCSKANFPLLHYLPEFAHTHIYWVGDGIQPSHHLSPPSPLALNLSQHQGFFQWVSSSCQVACIGTSTSASVLPMNIQGWFPLRLTGLISLQSKRLSKVFSSTSLKASVLRCSAVFIVQLSYPYMTTGKTKALTRRTFVGKVMSLFFNILSRLVITFLPRSKHLLISWLQSSSTVILEPPKIKSTTVSTVSPSNCHEVMGPDAIS